MKKNGMASPLKMAFMFIAMPTTESTPPTTPRTLINVVPARALIRPEMASTPNMQMMVQGMT